MHYSESQKLYLLNLINEQKSILFGAFSDVITKKVKEEARQLIYQKCAAQSFSKWERLEICERFSLAKYQEGNTYAINL